MTIKLSILDQSPYGEGESAEQGLQNTVRLAQAAEQLGYHRFWVSEHHNSSNIAGSAPEVLIGYLLAKTNTIKIGSGGVMLQHYSPYKVAEAFHVLSSLAPNRVDLGVGKAPGGLTISTQALQEDKKEEQKSFEQKLQDIHHYLHDNENSGELIAVPIPSEKPGIYLLGGSVESAELAARLGISFVFAYFINRDESVLKKARERYKDLSPEKGDNQFLLAVTISVAKSREVADSYVKYKETVKVSFSNGRNVNVSSFEQAEKLISQSQESEYTIKVQKAGYIADSKERVKEELIKLSEKYDVQEFIAISPIVDIEERIHSFQLLKEAFQLTEQLQEKTNEGVGI